MNLIGLARQFVAFALVGLGILTAASWPRANDELPIVTKVLVGSEASTYSSSKHLPFDGGLAREQRRQEVIREMKAVGWQPDVAQNAVLRRSYRQSTLGRQILSAIAPTLSADTYWHSDGYIYVESWDDSDNDTWEGYVEVCSNTEGCGAGYAQIHTGSGAILAASGSSAWSNAMQSWAGCSYAWCIGGSWGCLATGPGYWSCLGWACVGSAVGCGLQEWILFHQQP